MKQKQLRLITELENLVSQWQDRLFRFAYMRIGIREDAEDLIQDVFIALFNAMKSGKEIKDVGNYLFRSLLNACISYHRKSPPQQISLDEVTFIVADEQDKDIHEEFMRIRRLMKKLPKEQAETLMMKCYDGLTFREIAEIEEIPEATVKSRYRYAIMSLQRQLNER